MKQEGGMTNKETISLRTDASVQYLPQQVSMGSQSDLTVTGIASLDTDYQQQESEGCIPKSCTEKDLLIRRILIKMII